MKKGTNESSNNKKRNGLTTIFALIILLIGGYFGGDQLLDQRADAPLEDSTVISEEYTEDYYEEIEEEPTEVSEEAFEEVSVQEDENWEPSYRFRSKSLLNSHYEKHGEEMGFESAIAYEEAASKVAENENSLHKVEEEDGDYVYYLESTNEFVIVSTDGYIRTYFYPEDGLDYYNRQ